MFRVSPRDLLLAGLTSPSGAVIGAFLAVLYGPAADVLDASTKRSIESSAERVVESAPIVIGVVALLVIAALSVLSTALTFYGLRVTRDERRLRVRRGLLTERTGTLPLDRVHALRIVESPLRQLLGFVAIEAEVAGWAREDDTVKTIVPFVHRRELPRLLPTLIPGYAWPEVALERAPGRALRRYVVRAAAAPAVVAAALAAAPLVGAPLGWWRWIPAGAVLLAGVALGVWQFRAGGRRARGAAAGAAITWAGTDDGDRARRSRAAPSGDDDAVPAPRGPRAPCGGVVVAAGGARVVRRCRSGASAARRASASHGAGARRARAWRGVGCADAVRGAVARGERRRREGDDGRAAHRVHGRGIRWGADAPASGNVLVDSAAPPAEVKATAERVLRETFGYEAWVLVYDLGQLREIVEGYPFVRNDEVQHPYVVFSEDGVSAAELAATEDLDPGLEQVQLGPHGVLYWQVDRGQTLQSRIGKASGRARYKSTTTTRNLRTVEKLLA